MSRSIWVVGARLRMPQLQFFVAGAILFTLFTKDGESCKSYSGTVTSNVASDVWFLSRCGWYSPLVTVCACLIALVVVGAHFDVSCPCDFLVTADAPWMVLVSRCSAVLILANL